MNNEADKLVHEFNDEAWYAFHHGEINNDDDFYNFQHNWIETKVIYTSECKEICSNLDYDIFHEHDLFGKAENWSQAAYCAIYDLFNEHADLVKWDEMEEVLKESTQQI